MQALKINSTTMTNYHLMTQQDLDIYLKVLDKKKIAYVNRHLGDEVAQANYERILKMEEEAIYGFYNQLN
jgi:hypothetical protein